MRILTQVGIIAVITLEVITFHSRHYYLKMALPAHVVDPMRGAGVSFKWNVRPIIAQLTKNCIDAFERSMAIPAIIPDPMIINDQRVRFTIWASNMNVLGPPNSSLDYRLRYNLALVNILRKALNSIIRFLAYREYSVAHNGPITILN